jgi:hypothetical protein
MNLKSKDHYDEFLAMSSNSKKWETSLRDYSVKDEQPNKLRTKKKKNHFFHYGENCSLIRSFIFIPY